jgi:hypothetical protein
MNHNHLTEICQVFALGITTHAPERVYGGLLHIMWRAVTDQSI